MKRHLGDFVRRCLTCQRVKAEHQKPAGLLQPLEVDELKWEHVIMDFVIHLPWRPQRHDAMWVIVDRLTKSAHFLVVQMTFTLEQFCRLYIREIVRPHGVLDHEYSLPPTNRWSVREDHTGVRGHAASMRSGS